jgi:hypothetical protein
MLVFVSTSAESAQLATMRAKPGKMPELLDRMYPFRHVLQVAMWRYAFD